MGGVQKTSPGMCVKRGFLSDKCVVLPGVGPKGAPAMGPPPEYPLCEKQKGFVLRLSCNFLGPQCLYAEG
jgi:hypothetical protein